MPAKVVELHERARAGIVKGATLVAEAARVTLGPKGRNVLLEKSYGAPVVTVVGLKQIAAEKRIPRRMNRPWMPLYVGDYLGNATTGGALAIGRRTARKIVEHWA